MAAIPVSLIPVSERHGLNHWNDCVFCSGVVLANIACGGCKPATWAEAERLRAASGITIDSAGPWDLTRAFKVLYGWSVPEYTGTQDDLIAQLRGGKWGVVHVHYNLWPYALKLQKNFNGGHAMAMGSTDSKGNRNPGNLWTVDPLFVAGSGYKGIWVPEASVKRALYGTLANLLLPGQFGTPTHVPNPHVRCLEPFFVSFTVRKTSNSPLVLQAIGSSRRSAPVGSIIQVSMREYPVTMGNGSVVNLREIASGPYAGLWLSSHGSTPFSL